jgi:hypothetical protein
MNEKYSPMCLVNKQFLADIQIERDNLRIERDRLMAGWQPELERLVKENEQLRAEIVKMRKALGW